jgi:hypothetical protein
VFVVRSAIFVRMTVQRHLKRALQVFVVAMIQRGPLNEGKDQCEREGRSRPSTPSHASIVREGDEPVKQTSCVWARHGGTGAARLTRSGFRAAPHIAASFQKSK